MGKYLALLLVAILAFPASALADGFRAHMGEDVVIEEGQVLDGDAVAIMADVVVNGRITGDAVAVMGDVIVRGTVEGDAASVGGRVVVEESGRVMGEINQVAVGGLGRIMQYPGWHGVHWKVGRNFPIRTAVFNFLRFLGILTLGVLTLALFPRNVEAAAAAVDKDTGGKALRGLGLILVAPVVAVLLLFTIIGIPLIPVVLLLMVIAGFFGYLAISVFLGRKLNVHLNIKENLFVEYLLGAVALWLVQLVPFAGSIISAAVFVLSLGIAFDTRFGTRQA